MSEEPEGISLSSAIGVGSSHNSAADPVVPSSRPRAPTTTDQVNSSPPSASLGTSVARINARLATAGRVLALRVNVQTGMTIVEIKDASGRVLHEVPSRSLQHLADMLSAWADGKSILADVLA